MSAQDDVNQRLFEKIDALTAVVNDLRVEVVEMRTEMRLRKECPSPGECVVLSAKVAEHEKVIQQARGGWKLVTAAVISSGMLGGIVTNWLSSKP
jgi:hypothetical protein